MSIVTIPREIQLLIFGQLRVLDLVRVSETCHHLKEVARDPSLWKKLKLTYKRIKNKNKACRNHVSRCSSLREIFITGEQILIRSDKIMAVLMKAKNSLISINLSPSLGVWSNSSFEKIGEMTQLRHLAVGGGKIGPGGISALASLTELRTFKVPRDLNDQDTDTQTAALVDLYSKLKKLEQVEMRRMEFPAVESLVNNNPNLHHLDIKILSPFGGGCKSLILIAEKCPQLTHIGIGDLSVSDTSITKMVKNCPKIKHANFENTSFNDTALTMMSKNCPDLEYLNIVGCRNVTDEALERFANSSKTSNLKKLCISKYSRYNSPQLADRLKANLPNVELEVIISHLRANLDSDSDSG